MSGYAIHCDKKGGVPSLYNKYSATISLVLRETIYCTLILAILSNGRTVGNSLDQIVYAVRRDEQTAIVGSIGRLWHSLYVMESGEVFSLCDNRTLLYAVCLCRLVNFQVLILRRSYFQLHQQHQESLSWADLDPMALPASRHEENHQCDFGVATHGHNSVVLCSNEKRLALNSVEETRDKRLQA